MSGIPVAVMQEEGGGETRSRSSRKKKLKADPKKEAWLNNSVILAIRKMKLVGLRQALKPGLHWAERIFWVIVFFVCFGFSVYLTVVTVKEYSAHPILHTFHEDQPIHRVPFPGTTITGTSILRNNAYRDATNLFLMKEDASEGRSDEIIYKGQKWTEPVINKLMFAVDHFCELASSFATRRNILDESIPERLNLKERPEWVEKNPVTFLDDKDDPALRNYVLPFLKEKTLDCRNLLAACVWTGEGRACTELFVSIQTDVGTGCSFNRIPEEFLRKNEGFLSLFHQPEYSKEELKYWESFEAKNLDSIAAKGVQDFVSSLYPRVQHHSGTLTGLSFLIAFDSDEEGKSCPILDANGFLLGIHSPFEVPNMMQTGVPIPPKSEVFVKVKAELTIADEEIESLHIDKRKCYFQSENKLKNFKVYTSANCKQECLGRIIQTNCSCTLLTLSGGQKETLCGPLKAQCVQNITATMENGGYEKLCKDPICYPPCTELKYDADVSVLPYYEVQRLNLTNLNITVPTVPNGKPLVTSIGHVTFGPGSVTTRERRMQYSFNILFGVVGGVWGMSMEFSIITFANIFAGFALLIISNCCCCGGSDDDEEVEMEIRTRGEAAPAEGVSGTGGCVENAEPNQQDNPDSTLEQQTEQIPEARDEDRPDSFDKHSSLTSDTSDTSHTSESSSSESELTMDIELADIPAQKCDDTDEIKSPSNSEKSRAVASASDSNVGNQQESEREQVELDSKVGETNPEFSNESTSEPTEQNAEESGVQNEEASAGDVETADELVNTLDEPIDWDKLFEISF